MSKKSVTLKSSLIVFVSAPLREKLIKSAQDQSALTEEERAALALNEAEEEELKKAKEFFGVEDLNSVGDFTTTLENAMWSLFEKLPVPESPLRLKAHERNMQELAAKLESTLKSEELPVLDVKMLKSVMSLVEDPEQFKKVEFPFEYVNGEIKRVLTLPAVNVLADEEFVSALDEVFSPAAQ